MRRSGCSAIAAVLVITAVTAAFASAPAPPAAHAPAPATKAADAHAAPKAAAPAVPKSAGPTAAPSLGRTAATLALARLMGGNERFAAGRPTHPHQETAYRKELAAGQKPRAIVLSCADSRVPPEIVFDQGLGDVFVVRVAGQVLDAATVSSIEYAVEHLGAPLVVVMGHHACGAVKAALTVARGSAGSPDLERLLDGIRPGVRNLGDASAKDRLLDQAVRANVDAQLAGLLHRSALVREHAEAGKITVVPAVYKLESGRVEFWDAPIHQASATRH